MLLRLLHIGKSETRGHNFVLNAKFAEIDAANYDELLLLGGRAPEYLAHDPLVVALVIKFFSSGKALASICHRQLILAAAGVAKDRKCTAFPPVKPTLVASGARWVELDTMAATVVDGNLIAAATYEGHPEFIQHIMKALGGNISGSNKKILYICRVHSNDFQPHNLYELSTQGTKKLILVKVIADERAVAIEVGKTKFGEFAVELVNIFMVSKNNSFNS
ncbi:hypothetical protein HN51_045175 [Arachis hypogaea]